MTRSKACPIAATIRASLTAPTDDTAFDNSGISISSAGDINGDGFDDLISGPDILARKVAVIRTYSVQGFPHANAGLAIFVAIEQRSASHP
jgi:hypothetical protein